MKKHNTVKVVLITILVLMLLTWIFPAAYYSSGYVDQGRVQMGLFDLINYPITSLSYFGYIALFVIVVGGFYGILHKIPAYRNLLDRFVAKCKGKEFIVLSIIMVILAVLTSICGLQLGLFIFFPMLVSIILLMGYDKIVTALTLVGSTMIGIAGTTFAYSNTSLIVSVLSLDITSEILTKVIILIVGLILLIFNTFMYIKSLELKNSQEKKEEKKAEIKVEGEKSKSKAGKDAKSTKVSKTAKTTKSSKKDSKAAEKEEEVIVVKETKVETKEEDEYIPTCSESKKHKIWPFVLTLTIIFVILVLAFIPWSSSFNNTAFDTATEAVTDFELFGFPIFSKLLGTFTAFGTWAITDMILVLLFATLLLTLVYKVKFDDVLDGFAEGAKKVLTPALMVILIYTCLVITTYHPFQLTIYHAILGITDGFNVFTSTIVAGLASIFNADPAYTFQSVLPYLASIVTNTENYPIIGIVFQSIYGLFMLVAPTSVVLMIILSYLKISYGKWLKAIWKLFVEFLVILLIIFTILVLL